MTQTTQKAPAPRVGKGSPAGGRWFVTGSPEMTITVKPQDIIVSDTGKERAQKPVRIAFLRQAKPQKFIGSGMLGRANQGEGGGDGTDRNQPHMWGVYYTDNPAVLAFLREHEMYQKTLQDNVPEINLHLKIKELDWDPRAIPGAGDHTVRRFEAPSNEATDPIPPSNGAREVPAANVGIRQ